MSIALKRTIAGLSIVSAFGVAVFQGLRQEVRAEPVLASSATSGEYAQSAAAKAGWTSIEAAEYSEQHPVIAVFVSRGDFDLEKMSDERIQQVIDHVISQSLGYSEGTKPPTEYFFARGANQGGTGVRFYVNGHDVHYDKDGNGLEDPGETAYLLGESVSPEVQKELVDQYRANHVYSVDVDFSDLYAVKKD